jgi:acid phosphatase (class A)
MKSKILLQKFARIPALFLLLTLAAPVFAAENYLAPGQIDGIALLTPPPVADSPEQAADLAMSRSVINARSAADEARAMKSAKLTLFNFTPAIGEFFQPGKFPKLEQFYSDLKPELRATINVPKDHWKRLRPYQLDKTLSIGKPESSFSYPSGHSTTGTVQSLLLAELFPEKREAILEIGRNIGWDRVVIGKHFLTDVRAGRVFGQAIFRELMKSPAFQRDLAELKDEVQSSRRVKLEAATVAP